MSDLGFDLSRSLKVKCDSVIGLPIYGFLLMFNSNIWPSSAPLRDIRLQSLSDLDCELSRSLRVKCNSVIGLSIHVYAFLLMFNNNIWPSSAPLRDKRLRNLSNLEFDISRSLKVICDDVTGLSLYAFLLMFNGNIWPNSLPL